MSAQQQVDAGGQPNDAGINKHEMREPRTVDVGRPPVDGVSRRLPMVMKRMETVARPAQARQFPVAR